MRVEDDGAGFDPGKVLGEDQGGFGLGAARKRLEVVGGTLEIDSAPSEGTRISVTVPREVGGEAA